MMEHPRHYLMQTAMRQWAFERPAPLQLETPTNALHPAITVHSAPSPELQPMREQAVALAPA